MSDTKIQIRNNPNKGYVNHLRSLYKQERTIRLEIKFVESQIKQKQSYVSIRGFRNYDIHWCLKVLKGNLKANKSMINMVRERLVIC